MKVNFGSEYSALVYLVPKMCASKNLQITHILITLIDKYFTVYDFTHQMQRHFSQPGIAVDFVISKTCRTLLLIEPYIMYILRINTL